MHSLAGPDGSLEYAQEVFDITSVALSEEATTKEGSFMPTKLETAGVTGFQSDEPCVVYDQPHICILWKPPGWIVSVGDGEEENQMNPEQAERWRGCLLQRWVSREWGQSYPIAQDDNYQYGIIHRLDRATSGLVAWAKSYRGYNLARLQWSARRVQKGYVCVCNGWLRDGPRIINAPLLINDARWDGRRASVSFRQGQPAYTEIRAVGRLCSPENEAFSLLELGLLTGRTHQIRAHLSAIGHPVLHDQHYGGVARPWCPRIFLHSHLLCFDLGLGDGPLHAHCPLPRDLQAVLARLNPVDSTAAALLKKWSL